MKSYAFHVHIKSCNTLHLRTKSKHFIHFSARKSINNKIIGMKVSKLVVISDACLLVRLENKSTVLGQSFLNVSLTRGFIFSANFIYCVVNFC